MTPEYVLNPLAIYRMARQDIKHGEKSVSERGTLGSSSVTGTSPPENNSRSPDRAANISPTTSPVAVAPVGSPIVAPIDWSLPELYPLPTTFDDLQTYMQLSLLSSNGEFLPAYQSTTQEPETAYTGIDLSNGMAPSSIVFPLPDVSGGDASFPTSVRHDYR